MPASAWIRLPRSLTDRLRGRQQQIPWIVPEAVERLGALLAADWQVFEFGSGVSTVWYATRVDHITSVEDDNEWFTQVRRMLAARGLTNADIHLTLPRLFPDEIARFEDATFDLVVVDGNEVEGTDRMRCLAAARSKVRPGGYLLLDDSDREQYSYADELLAGWLAERFVGVKAVPLTAVETTLYRRPLSFS